MSEEHDVFYSIEPKLPAVEFGRVLAESGLGTIRPTDDEDRLTRMIAGASLAVTARWRSSDGHLIGVARLITDGVWCAYLSDLAVSPDARGLHVGRGLIAETRRRLGPEVALVLFSVPEAAGFYERIGMERMPDAFWFRRER